MTNNTLLAFPLSLSHLSLENSDLYRRRKYSRENSFESSRENSRHASKENLFDENLVNGVYEDLGEWHRPPPVPPRNFPNVYGESNSALQCVTKESGYRLKHSQHCVDFSWVFILKNLMSLQRYRNVVGPYVLFPMQGRFRSA